MLNEINPAFFPALTDSFFTQHGKHLTAQLTKKNSSFPFKDHVQFALLTDILIRKYTHHALLQVNFSNHSHLLFLEAFLQHLSSENIPHVLRQAELVYLDLENLSLTKPKQKLFEKEVEALLLALDSADKYLLFAISNYPLFSKKKISAETASLRKQLEILLHHPKCRFLILTNAKHYFLPTSLDLEFSKVQIANPSDIDILTLLKQERSELETFHHVIISEETLNLAYMLASRYLSAELALDQAVLLLDSSAARINTLEKIDLTNANKRQLTSTHLLQVLSAWTHIPASHLQLRKFKLNDFLNEMQQRVFGQEAALSLIGQGLQQAQIHLQKNTSSFGNFLFVGPKHAGKKSTAIALTEYLFKQLHMFYIAEMGNAKNISSLLDLKLQHHLDKNYCSLKDVINEKPYAVIFIENIEEANESMLLDLYEVLNTGFLHAQGKRHHFQQTTLLLSTTLCSNRLTQISEQFSQEEENEHVDLMELIMREQKHSTIPKRHHYSPQDLVNEIIADVSTHLPATLCQQLHLVPFLLLQKPAIQNIIHLKLRQLGKMLDSRYNIELGYAPEVVRFFASEILEKQANGYQSVDIDSILNQLYSTIEQAIFSQLENKNRPNQLFLQLNETGQSLRCDWLAMPSARHHAS